MIKDEYNKMILRVIWFYIYIYVVVLDYVIFKRLFMVVFIMVILWL